MDAKTLLMIAFRAGLIALGTFLATHGAIQGSAVETFSSAAPILASLVLSGWDKWGRPLIEAELEVWKLKAQANAAALRKANVPVPLAPTATQVDAITSSTVSLKTAQAAIVATEVAK